MPGQVTQPGYLKPVEQIWAQGSTTRHIPYIIGFVFLVIGSLFIWLTPFFWRGAIIGVGIGTFISIARDRRRNRRKQDEFLRTLSVEQEETALTLFTRALRPDWANTHLNPEEIELIDHLRELNLLRLGPDAGDAILRSSRGWLRPSRKARPFIKRLQQRQALLEKRLNATADGTRSRQSLLTK